MEEQWLIDLRNFECEEPDSSEIISSCAFPNRKGGKHTEETRQLMSKTFSGEGNNFYGKKHTEETKRKMREAQSKVGRSGKNNPMTKHTPEAKEKMRLAWERRRAIIREKASTSK